jgi:hypothetical protein
MFRVLGSGGTGTGTGTGTGIGTGIGREVQSWSHIRGRAPRELELN